MSEMPFRSHHEAVPVTSPLYRSLGVEWVALGLSPSSAISVRRWGRTHPVLAPYASIGELVDAVDAAEARGTDALLGALIAAFQGGAQLAGRVVLQAMLPKLTSMAVSTSATSTDDVWVEDRRHIIVAEFWSVLSSYPLAQRPRSVAGNLALDTLHRVTAGKRRPVEIAIDLSGSNTERGVAALWSSEATNLEDDDDPPGPGRELAAVVAWGREQAVVNAGDAALLTTIYSASSTRAGFEREAARLGVTPAAVRQRCSRAARAIAAAVQSQTRAGQLCPDELAA